MCRSNDLLDLRVAGKEGSLHLGMGDFKHLESLNFHMNSEWSERWMPSSAKLLFILPSLSGVGVFRSLSTSSEYIKFHSLPYSVHHTHST